jgi:ABC-2 type transport system permease protein
VAEALALYGRLVGARLQAQMQYRASFLADFAATFLGLISEFAAIAVFFRHTPALGGWSLPEVALLYGTAELALGVPRVLLDGFDRLPEAVRRGEFDRVLARPRGAFFQVLASDIGLSNTGRIVQALVVLAIGLRWLEVDWTAGEWLFLGWTIAGGSAFFAGLFVIGAAFAFWTIEGLELMNVLTYGGATLASYPFDIFAAWLRNLFLFVIPLACVNFYPLLYLLDKPDPFGLPAFVPFLSAPACGLVLLAALALWRLGVRHYQSTGH